MISVPDSVAFYWGDPVNRAAVDVLSGGTEVPADLSLPEAERFELAALAARRVRVEYWTLLRALWAATWGEAVRAHLPGAKLLGYGEHAAFADATETYADPSIDYAWENTGVSGVFAVPKGGRLFTALWLVEGEAEVQLQLYLIDAEGSCAVSDGLDLGPDWGDDGGSRRETVAGRLPFAKAEDGIAPEPFAAFARAAIVKLAAALA